MRHVSTWGGSAFACLWLVTGCRAATSRLELSEHARVDVPADWQAVQDRGRTVLSRPGAPGRIDLSAVPTADHGVTRTPVDVLAALTAQVDTIPGGRVLVAEATHDRARLELAYGGLRRKHWAVFLPAAVVHVSCIGLPEEDETCDAIAASLRGVGESRASSATTTKERPVYPVMAAPEFPVVTARSKAPSSNRMAEYAAGVAARARQVEAQRLAGTELVP